MKKEEFVKYSNWYGYFFEVCIEYTTRLDNELLEKIFNTIWKHESFEGPWTDKINYGSPVVEIDKKYFSTDTFSNHLYGLINVKNKNIGCLSLTVREEIGSDWIDICIPAAMLELQFENIEYPIKLDNPVIKKIEEIFIDVAKKIYRIKPFDLALIGEEVSGILSANTLTIKDLNFGGILVPKHTSTNKKLIRLNTQEEIDDNLLYLPLRNDIDKNY